MSLIVSSLLSWLLLMQMHTDILPTITDMVQVFARCRHRTGMNWLVKFVGNTSVMSAWSGHSNPGTWLYELQTLTFLSAVPGTAWYVSMIVPDRTNLWKGPNAIKCTQKHHKTTPGTSFSLSQGRVKFCRSSQPWHRWLAHQISYQVTSSNQIRPLSSTCCTSIYPEDVKISQ